MLDSILNTVRRGAERVQRRGEEVAHVARLRVEVFQLGRELDGLYARLGRSFHAGAEVSVLQGVRDEIGRVEEEIRARERLIQELGDPPEDDVSAGTTSAPVRSTPAPPSSHVSPEVSPMPRSDALTTSGLTMQRGNGNAAPDKATAIRDNEPGRDPVGLENDPVRPENTVGQADALKEHDDPLET